MAGRPTAYKEEYFDLASKYLSDDESVNYLSYGHAIPSVVGLTRVIGVARSTMYKWAEEEGHPFSDILTQNGEFQELSTLNGALNGSLNAQIAKLVLGKHGYHDKQDNTLSGPEGRPVEVDHQVTFVGVDGDQN